ncbi:MAG: DUF1636 domain-containing protein [Pseudomonadota bacterium]
MAEALRNKPREVTASDGSTEHVGTLSICLRCRDGQEDSFGDERGGVRLAKAVVAAGVETAGVAVRGVHCLSQCKRPYAVAISGPERFTYLFGDLDPARDVAAVIALAQLYAASPSGFMARDSRPESMQAGVLGRVPPFGWRGDAVETVDLIPHPASETPR